MSAVLDKALRARIAFKGFLVVWWWCCMKTKEKGERGELGNHLQIKALS